MRLISGTNGWYSPRIANTSSSSKPAGAAMRRSGKSPLRSERSEEMMSPTYASTCRSWTALRPSALLPINSSVAPGASAFTLAARPVPTTAMRLPSRSPSPLTMREPLRVMTTLPTRAKVSVVFHCGPIGAAAGIGTTSNWPRFMRSSRSSSEAGTSFCRRTPRPRSIMRTYSPAMPLMWPFSSGKLIGSHVRV